MLVPIDNNLTKIVNKLPQRVHARCQVMWPCHGHGRQVWGEQSRCRDERCIVEKRKMQSPFGDSARRRTLA